MVKISKKVLISVLSAVVIAALIFTAFASLYKRKVYWHERTADYNISNWYNIERIALNIDRQGYTLEILENWYPHINSVVSSCTSPLMPPINGNGRAHSFMGTWYDPLVQTIISGKLSEDKQKEGIALFEEMNKEFLTVCSYITGEIPKEELVVNNSEEYEQAEQKITEFCNKYAEKIHIFNNED